MHSGILAMHATLDAAAIARRGYGTMMTARMMAREAEFRSVRSNRTEYKSEGEGGRERTNRTLIM